MKLDVLKFNLNSLNKTGRLQGQVAPVTFVNLLRSEKMCATKGVYISLIPVNVVTDCTGKPERDRSLNSLSLILSGIHIA